MDEHAATNQQLPSSPWWKSSAPAPSTNSFGSCAISCSCNIYLTCKTLYSYSHLILNPIVWNPFHILSGVKKFMKLGIGKRYKS